MTLYLGYDLANQTAYLDDMLRWGLDWLIKVSCVPTCIQLSERGLTLR